MGSIPTRPTMDYNQLVQELNSPKPVWENGEVKTHKPPTSLELRAARAIVSLQEVIQGIARSNNTHAEEVPKETNEDHDLQRPAP